MSSVLGVGVVMHVLHLPDERYVVLIGAARGGCKHSCSPDDGHNDARNMLR